MARRSQKTPGTQLPLFEDDRVPGNAIINVASVPQRSVFRYPGGKTWLVPYARKWLRTLPQKPAELIEPFAGGGIIGLTAAFENLVDQVILVELDPQVASVWKTILGEDALWLAERIASFDLTAENIEAEFAHEPASIRERAFQTILKNRINRGGILAAGAGRIKQGENGKGLASRWYPHTLKKRILAIYAIRNQLQFIEVDGLEVISRHISASNAAFFIDPPYTVGGKRAGNRLYTCAEMDHEALFRAASELVGSFLMTYDNAEDVQSLAGRYGFVTKTVAMKNTHHATMHELLISRRLDWLDSVP